MGIFKFYIFFAVILSSLSMAEENQKSSAVGTPSTKEECLEKGGEWIKHLILSGYFCALKTTDAGKSCFDDTQCQGDCIPSNQFAKAGDLSMGQCAEIYPIPVGCPTHLAKGKVVVVSCI